MFNTARVEALELDNLVETAQGDDRVRGGAQGKPRRPRRAADYPNARRRELAEAHAVVSSEGNRLDYKPVNLKPLTVEPSTEGAY